MIKGSIQEEDKTIIDIYAPNIGAPQHIRQILTTNYKKEISSNQQQWMTVTPQSSAQLSSVPQSCSTLSDPMDCSTPGFLSITNSRSLLKLKSIESVMPSNHLILCCPLFLLPSIFPRNRVFSSESVLHIRWTEDWSFTFSISPSNEHPGLISFRMDWLDLLAVQGTLKSLLKYHSSKASILQHSASFIVQFPHPYMTTGKNHSFDQTDFCWQSNVSAFYYLSRLV